MLAKPKRPALSYEGGGPNPALALGGGAMLPANIQEGSGGAKGVEKGRNLVLLQESTLVLEVQGRNIDHRALARGGGAMLSA